MKDTRVLYLTLGLFGIVTVWRAVAVAGGGGGVGAVDVVQLCVARARLVAVYKLVETCDLDFPHGSYKTWTEVYTGKMSPDRPAFKVCVC